MRLRSPDVGAISSAWSTAFFPTFVWLGVALPCFFLASIDQYLYYLRPWELVPTYGTAWLLLAVLVVPASLLFWLALIAANRPSTRGIYRILVIGTLGLASVAAVAALAYGFVAWLRTFEFHITSHIGTESVALLLSVVSFVVGLAIAIVPGSRPTLTKLYSFSFRASVLGALSLVSLPFCRWESDPATLAPGVRASSATLRSKPNILLVTIDTLSAEHMSLYGSERETTPRLEAFARGAIVFERAYANSNFTSPGIASILTATRPWTHRSLQLASWPLSEARRNSLPALLHRAGYQTGYVATSPVAGAATNGFGAYFGFSSSDRLRALSVCRDGLETVLRYECVATHMPPFLLAEIIKWRITQILGLDASTRPFDPRLATQPALEWLAKTDQRSPVFLWVHLLPPHAPYAAPEPWLGQFDSSLRARGAASSSPEEKFSFARVASQRVATLDARYDESVKYVDYYVGEYLERALALLGPNTAVIVVADHGESFAHGYGGHGGPCLFESLIHIPLLVKLPFQSQGLRTTTPTEQVDIAPTVAALLGITAPRSWEGRSLLPLMEPSETAVRLPIKPVFAMNFEENPRRSALTTGSVAVIDGPWKLVHFEGALRYPQMPQLRDELYNLAVDPRELRNRISEEATEAQRLRNVISLELAQRGGPLP